MFFYRLHKQEYTGYNGILFYGSFENNDNNLDHYISFMTVKESDMKCLENEDVQNELKEFVYEYYYIGFQDLFDDDGACNFSMYILLPDDFGYPSLIPKFQSLSLEKSSWQNFNIQI